MAIAAFWNKWIEFAHTCKPRGTMFLRLPYRIFEADSQSRLSDGCIA